MTGHRVGCFEAGDRRVASRSRGGPAAFREPWLAIGLAALLAAASPARAEVGGSAAAPAFTQGLPVRICPDSLFGVAVGADGVAVATGYHGAVLSSPDGGVHWTRINAGDGALVRRVALLGDGTVFAVASDGRILKGTAGAAGWQTVYDAQGLYLRDVAFATDKIGWAVGHDGLILKTSDGGATWQEQGLKNWPGRDQPRLSGIAAIDDANAVIVGEFGVVAQTSDGGTTWTIVSSNTLPTLLAVAMHGETGYAVGLNGALVHLSVPRGVPAQAELVASGLTQHLLSVALSPDGAHAVIGGRSVLIDFTDGKATPLDVPAEAGLEYAYIAGIAIGADGTTLAVGQNGLVLRAAAPQGPYELVGMRGADTDAKTPKDPVTQ